MGKHNGRRRPLAAASLLGIYIISHGISHIDRPPATRERGESYIDTEMHYVWGLPSVEFTKCLAILRVHITEIIIVEYIMEMRKPEQEQHLREKEDRKKQNGHSA